MARTSVITTDTSGILSIGNKPSVYDVVDLIGHDSAPILSMISRTKAGAPVHSWIIDDIGDPEVETFMEISAPADGLAPNKQQTTNAVQIIKTTASLSFDQEATQVYGRQTEEAHQKQKAAKQHLMKQEKVLLGIQQAHTTVYDSPVPRQSNTVAGVAAGIPYFLTLNEATFTSGRRGNIFAIDSAGDGTGTKTALTLDLLDEFASIPYEKNARVTDIFCGVNMKRRINSLFDRQLTNEKMANTTVETIDLTTGKARLHLHPYMTDANGLGDAIIGGDFSYMKWAVLKENNRPLPTDESAYLWEYYISGCPQVTNAWAFAMMIGIAK